MEIINNKTQVPLEHYRQNFAAANPSELAARSGVPFENGAFHVTLLGRKIEVTYPDMRFTLVSDGTELRDEAKILVVRLITEGKLLPAREKLLSYAEVPWGRVYLANFTGRCIKRLAFGFANTPEKFAQACKALGGTEVSGGDAAFDVPFVPGLTVRLIIWAGEDDIPPSSQILFSDNFPAAFSAEDMAVVGDILIDTMKGRPLSVGA